MYDAEPVYGEACRCFQPLPPLPPAFRREQLGPSNSPNLVYPAGCVYVRCGWVSEQAGPGARMTDQVRRHGRGWSQAGTLGHRGCCFLTRTS